MAPTTRGGPSGKALSSRTSKCNAKKASSKCNAKKAKKGRSQALADLPWPYRSADQKTKYCTLANRPMACPRYVDENTLSHLELDIEVHQYLANIGWEHFCQNRLPVHRELTLEFLSSFSCQLNPSDPQHPGFIKFRIIGVDHVISMEIFNRLFHFPQDGHREIPETFHSDSAWLQLTGSSSYTYYSKASQILRPALRYLHRFMAHSFFARGESTGVVSRNELFMLWAMITGTKVNSGFWLCQHLDQVARATTGKICVGGIISYIACTYGFLHDPSRDTLVTGNDRIDLDTLVHMGMCQKDDFQYYLLDSHGNIIPKRRATEEAGHATGTPGHATGTPRPGTSSWPHVPSSVSERTTLDLLIIRLERMETQMVESFHQLCTRLARVEASTSRLEGMMNIILGGSGGST